MIDYSWIKKGVSVRWNDPDVNNRDLTRVWEVAEVPQGEITGDTIILITDEPSEAEVTAKELQRAFLLFSDIDSRDIYYIQEEQNIKYIHIDGFYYSTGGDGFRFVNPVGMSMALSEFIEAFNGDGGLDKLSEWYSANKQYIASYDTADEAMDSFREQSMEYGEPKPMPFELLTEQTECGCYIDSRAY